MPIERYLLKVVAKCAYRYNLYFETPEGMKRKINILKDCNSRNRKIKYSIVLPCLSVDKYEQKEKSTKEMKRGISVDQFNKSVAGELTDGIIDNIINGISQYANVSVSVNHFIFHFLHLDQRILKNFSRVI